MARAAEQIAMIPKKWRTVTLTQLAWEIAKIIAFLGLGAVGVLALLIKLAGS